MAVPVILDTDIGFDVDDVWALVFALNCPEIDLKLITTTTGDTVYRARIVAKLLQLAGREDIPIGIGIPLDESARTHSEWLGDFSLTGYAGEVYRDGIGAICDVVTASEEEVSIVCIGPLPNIAAALAREPEIKTRARFVGMHGSVRRGYLGYEKPMREYNVKQHSLACQAVFAASWPKLITPLDTCGTIILDGDRFADVSASDKVLTQAVMDNHRGWFEAVKDWPLLKDMDSTKQSSILYDSVAIYLAFSTEHLVIEDLPIAVTDDGKTLIEEGASVVQCATEWTDKEAFLDFLVERLA